VLIAAWFGASGQVSTYRVAAQVPILIYDFLIGGMLGAALVPVLSDYAQRGRGSLRLVSALLAIFTVILAVLALLLALAAPQLAWLLAGGFAAHDPALLALTAVDSPACAVGLAAEHGRGDIRRALCAAALYRPVATAVFNLGVVVAVPLFAPELGIYSLPLVCCWAVAQLVLMATDMPLAVSPSAWWPDWSHPALRRILWLYLPIAAGLLVSLFQVGLTGVWLRQQVRPALPGWRMRQPCSSCRWD
jgi:putative peptidoglycan lipid II flippase